MAANVEPLRVSPFIKFCRWSFLLMGIFYGSARYAALSKKQKAIRDNYELDRPQREMKAAAERKKRIEEEYAMLSEAFGSKMS